MVVADTAAAAAAAAARRISRAAAAVAPARARAGAVPARWQQCARPSGARPSCARPPRTVLPEACVLPSCAQPPRMALSRARLARAGVVFDRFVLASPGIILYVLTRANFGQHVSAVACWKAQRAPINP